MKTKEKWFNNPQLVTMLLFFLTPLGVYGLYKSETIKSKWKNITSIVFVIVLTIFIIAYLS